MEIHKEDFDSCCRCCLRVVNVLKPIFGACLNDMLSKLMDIQITQNDGYPQQMCSQCVLKLSSAYTFYTMVMKNHKTLEDILKAAQKNGELSIIDITSENGKEFGTSEKKIKTMEVEVNTLEKQHGCQDKITFNQDFNSKLMEEKQNMPVARLSAVTESERSEGSSNEDDYQCSQCEYNSKEQEAFKTHLRTHLIGFEHISTADVDTCAQLCNICGAQFRWRTSLLKHLRQHRGRHKCEVCHKVFGEAATLNVHMVRHSSNQKPYQCIKCDRSFTQQSSLRKHAQTHDARTQLRCDQCGKDFLHKYTLLRHHENAHLPTECPLCKNIFPGKKLLDSHMKLHKKEIDSYTTDMLTGDTIGELINVETVTVEFLCLICSQKFQCKESLEVHICSREEPLIA